MSLERGAPCNYVGLRAVSGWPSLSGHADCMDRAARRLEHALKTDLTKVVQRKTLEGHMLCRQSSDHSSNVVEQTDQKMEK